MKESRMTYNQSLGIAMRSKKLIIIGLFILGGVEIFYGVLFGRLRIYAQELPFFQSLRLGELSPEQRRAYADYITLFKDQWHIVAWFGALTLAAAVILLLSERKRV
jgi:hypothetical protein